MAMIAVRRFVPPAACDHEPVRLGDGSVRCIRCDYAYPRPKPDERLQHQLEHAIAIGDRAAVAILRGRIAAARPLAPGEAQELYGR